MPSAGGARRSGSPRSGPGDRCWRFLAEMEFRTAHQADRREARRGGAGDRRGRTRGRPVAAAAATTGAVRCRSPTNASARLRGAARPGSTAIRETGLRGGRHRNHAASTRCGPNWSASRLCVEAGKACYIPLGHKAGRRRPVRLRRAGRKGRWTWPALATLKPVLEDESILKIGQNMKYDCEDLRPARHPCRADRRHDADVLRDACRTARPRHGHFCRETLPRPYTDPDQAAAGLRQVGDHIRPGADRRCRALCRRGCRRHPPALGAVEAATARRGR